MLGELKPQGPKGNLPPGINPPRPFPCLSLPRASAVGTDVPRTQGWAAGGAYATRRLGSALEGVPVPHLNVGWQMAMLCLGSALPWLLVCAFALR